jgi:hypothetical protein
MGEGGSGAIALFRPAQHLYRPQLWLSQAWGVGLLCLKGYRDKSKLVQKTGSSPPRGSRQEQARSDGIGSSLLFLTLAVPKNHVPSKYGAGRPWNWMRGEGSPD